MAMCTEIHDLPADLCSPVVLCSRPIRQVDTLVGEAMRTTCYVRSLCLAIMAAAAVLADDDEVIIESKPLVPGESTSLTRP